jgi:hypothetical protein
VLNCLSGKLTVTIPFLEKRESTEFLKRIKEFSLSGVQPPPESRKRAEQEGDLIFTATFQNPKNLVFVD